MNNPQTLWHFYTVPFQPTEQQLDSNFFRIANSDITTQQLDDWKNEFIKRLKLDDKRADYLRKLTMDGLRKKWDENKPQSITLENYRKSKKNGK